jgi:hypothetical protein
MSSFILETGKLSENFDGTEGIEGVFTTYLFPAPALETFSFQERLGPKVFRSVR